MRLDAAEGDRRRDFLLGELVVVEDLEDSSLMWIARSDRRSSIISCWFFSSVAIWSDMAAICAVWEIAFGEDEAVGGRLDATDAYVRRLVTVEMDGLVACGLSGTVSHTASGIVLVAGLYSLVHASHDVM